MSVFLTPLHFEKTLFRLLETLDMFQDLEDQQEQKYLLTVSGLTETSTLTLNSGIVCNGAGDKYKLHILQFQRILQLPVTMEFAEFNNIEIYEGNFISQNFTVDTSLFNQRYILDNSFIDTSTIKVKVKPSVIFYIFCHL